MSSKARHIIKKNQKEVNQEPSKAKNEEKDFIKETLKSKNIKINDNQMDLVIQIMKFILVGGIATIIDWIIYFILYKFVKLNPLYANIISFSISVIYNYYASCKYVFKVDMKKSKARRFIEFIFFALIGLALNEIIIFGLVTKLKWNAMIVKVLATAVVMVFNFVTRKKFLEEK